MSSPHTAKCLSSPPRASEEAPTRTCNPAVKIISLEPDRGAQPVERPGQVRGLSASQGRFPRPPFCALHLWVCWVDCLVASQRTVVRFERRPGRVEPE